MSYKGRVGPVQPTTVICFSKKGVVDGLGPGLLSRVQLLKPLWEGISDHAQSRPRRRPGFRDAGMQTTKRLYYFALFGRLIQEYFTLDRARSLFVCVVYMCARVCACVYASTWVHARTPVQCLRETETTEIQSTLRQEEMVRGEDVWLLLLLRGVVGEGRGEEECKEDE